MRDRWAPVRVRSNDSMGTSPSLRRNERRHPPPNPDAQAAGWIDPDLARGVPDRDSDEQPIPRMTPSNGGPGGEQRRRVIYPMGISRARLEQVIRELGVPALVGHDENEADTVLVLKSVYRKQPDRVDEVQSMGKPVYVLRTGTTERLREVIADLFGARITPGHPLP